MGCALSVPIICYLPYHIQVPSIVPVIYSIGIVLQEVPSLRARRWCFLGPLRAVLYTAVHYTIQELSIARYAMQGQQRGAQERRGDEGAKERGKGRKRSLGLLVVRQQELG